MTSPTPNPQTIEKSRDSEEIMPNPAESPRESDEPSDLELEAAAWLYVQQLRAFIAHAAVFVAGMVVIFLVNFATNAAAGITGQWSAWWSIWAFLGWGSGIAVHGLVVRLNRPASSASSWEKRQIDKLVGR